LKLLIFRCAFLGFAGRGKAPYFPFIACLQRRAHMPSFIAPFHMERARGRDHSRVPLRPSLNGSPPFIRAASLM
jgi:hypothetical protein